MNSDLVILGVAAAVFLILALLIMAFGGDGGQKKFGKRLSKVRERYSTSREAQAQAQMRRLISNRQSKLDTAMSGFIPNRALLTARLERTGKNWTFGQYGVASGGIMAATLIGAIIAGAPWYLALAGGLFLGLAIPHKVVDFLINRRMSQFNSNFPDAIDLMVRGLRSGLPISESLGIVGRETPDPVGYEFRTVTDKIRIGRTMEHALQDAANKLQSPEFQFFVITLAIQRETGGNLAETLNNLGDVLRKRAQMKLKIRAMSSESKASAYIVGSLPFIVSALISAVNPAYLAPFFVDQRLMIAAVGGLVWMSIGVFIMAKMVSFEI